LRILGNKKELSGDYHNAMINFEENLNLFNQL